MSRGRVKPVAAGTRSAGNGLAADGQTLGMRAAFFNLDRTLLRRSSALARRFRSQGRSSRLDLAKAVTPRRLHPGLYGVPVVLGLALAARKRAL